MPPLTDQLSCPFSVDGHSHFPIYFADNTSFGTGGRSAGNYEYRMTMVDATGNGWSIIVRVQGPPAELTCRADNQPHAGMKSPLRCRHAAVANWQRHCG